MSLITLLLLAVALGADALSLSIGLGIAGISHRQKWQLIATIFIFHVVMPVIGYYAGHLVGDYVGRIAAIIGAAILLFLGMQMIKQGLLGDEEAPTLKLASATGLLILAASVSIDALSVGFTLGTQDVNLAQAAAAIGITAGIMTYLGLAFGSQIGKYLGGKAQIAGGAILIIIGISLFF